MESKIGFMQGRLSNIVNNQIQAFPWNEWEKEFQIASKIKIFLMEWTLDQKELYKNPLMTLEGRKRIKELTSKYKIQIPSLTGDCFMQRPFWKETNKFLERQLKLDFINVCKSASKLGINYVVVPLVDNGSIESKSEEKKLIKFLIERENIFIDLKIKIVFESDKNPECLKKFIADLNPDLFGINYDIGNSASLGFNPRMELDLYGERVLNVHIKDRVLNGTTVPLGEGNADFYTVFQKLSEINYKGNFILQTARAVDNNHSGLLKKYRKNVLEMLDELSFY